MNPTRWQDDDIRRLERTLAALCTRGLRNWWILDTARPLFDLQGVRRHLPLDTRDGDGYAVAVREHFEDMLLLVENHHHRVILEVVLGLGDDRWRSKDWRQSTARTRREEAGRLFRGDDGRVTGGTIRQLHEPRAIGELAQIMSAYETDGADESWSGILGPDGRPLKPDSPLLAELVTDVGAATERLIRRVATQPNLLHNLTARQFEEVVVELLERQGYDITLTPPTRDGGVDIFAAKRDALGSFLYVVECKKYSADNHVGVGIVRELLGVVAQHRATAGVLATTSFFTSGAKQLQQSMRWQLSLKDYKDIGSWLCAERVAGVP